MTAGALELIGRAQERAIAAGSHGTMLLCVASQLTTELSDVALQAGEVTARSSEISAEGRRTADVTAEMRQLIAEARVLYTALEKSSDGLNVVRNELAAIAHETRIVALNALIEAARVGALGAPFAVVAKEVQALARKAAEASQGIETRTATIRDGIANGAAIMHRLDAGVQTVDDSVGVVSGAVREQHAMLERLTTGVQTISTGVDDAVNGPMSDVTEAAMLLQEDLAELQQHMESSAAPTDTEAGSVIAILPDATHEPESRAA